MVMKEFQIYRDITLLLEYWMHRGWSESLPKIWRFTIYPSGLNYLLEMLSASSDAYEFQDERLRNINIVISNLRKFQTICRQLNEKDIISNKQMDYLTDIINKIDTQSKKWKNSVKKYT